jgi:uncharacterized membrane protein HdeD (DUF308 family)
MSDATSPGYRPVRHWHGQWWSIAAGAVILILGIAGLFMTVSLTVVTVRWYGVLLIVAGAVQLIEAVTQPGGDGEAWSSRVVRILVGILYIAGGLYAASSPVRAALALTLLLGLVLIASGLARAVWVFAHEARHSRAVLILLAVVSVVLGIALLSQWPLSGLWAIGLFVSCELIASGLSWIWMGFSSGQGSGAAAPPYIRQ